MSIADMRTHTWLADAENEQLQKEGSHVYDDPVKSTLAATGTLPLKWQTQTERRMFSSLQNN